VLGTRTLFLLLSLSAVALGASLQPEDPAAARYGHLPIATVFGSPVGFPDGSGYYDAQDFGKNYHLGEDWNGVRGGATDKGDPVASMAAGLVTYADDAGPGWGHVVRVVHHVRRGGESHFVESLYAHLDRIDVAEGDTVSAGDALGTIGDAHGRYSPHLHLEVRRQPDLPLGPGYSADQTMHLDPSQFITEMRRGSR